jgi:FKBP-type peptidyl-prolyl cis-trans isomerase
MTTEDATQPAGDAPGTTEQQPVTEPVQHNVTDGLVASTAAATVGQLAAPEAVVPEEEKTAETQTAPANEAATMEPASSQSQQQQQQTEEADFVVTASRVPIMSWGSGSGPSLPSVESLESDMSVSRLSPGCKMLMEP